MVILKSNVRKFWNTSFLDVSSAQLHASNLKVARFYIIQGQSIEKFFSIVWRSQDNIPEIC